MKLFFSSLFVFLHVIAFTQQPVKIFVSYTNSYCGGARPSEQILTKYNTPNKLSNSKIKLVGKKVYLITTDSAGFFYHKLKPGKYSVFLTEEKPQKLYINYDPSCTKMLKLAFAQFEIKKGETEYSINLYFPCNPCQTSNKP